MSPSLLPTEVGFMQVLVVLKGGQLAYQRVFMFSHRDASKTSDFVTLHIASGAHIQLSPSHYIWGALTSPLRHSQIQGTTATWRSRKATNGSGQGRQRGEFAEAVRDEDNGESESSNGAGQDSVTVSRRHLLNTFRIWLEAFGSSQVIAIRPNLNMHHVSVIHANILHR
jgi:hypothetical protein